MIDLKGFSDQALSDTIGAIYDCALDPDRKGCRCLQLGRVPIHIAALRRRDLVAIGEAKTI